MPIIDTVYPPTHTHRHTTNTHTQRETRSAAAVSVCIVGDPEVVHEGGIRDRD